MDDNKHVALACVVHEPDATNLGRCLDAVACLKRPPQTVIIADNDGSEEIRRAIAAEEANRDFSVIYRDCNPNRGFNTGFRAVLSFALSRPGFDYLATLTVRARPEPQWLGAAIDVLEGNMEWGACATVQLRDDQVSQEDVLIPEANNVAMVHGIGHYYLDNGGLYDLGNGLDLRTVKRKIRDLHPDVLWSPCSGAAVYRTRALSSPESVINWIRPRGFKSYNCNMMAWYLRENGWKIGTAWGAVSRKQVGGSTSAYPRSPGLLINQELNRIEQVCALWPEPERSTAVRRYLQEQRRMSESGDSIDSRCRLGPADRRIVVTRAEGAIDPVWLDSAMAQLRSHLKASAEYHRWAYDRRHR